MRISDLISDVCSSDLQRPSPRASRYRPWPRPVPAVRPPPAPDPAAVSGPTLPRARRRHHRSFRQSRKKIPARLLSLRTFTSPQQNASVFIHGMHPRQRLHRKGHQRDFQKLDVGKDAARSEEHTSELQSLMRISYAVFCLKKKKTTIKTYKTPAT